MADSRSGLERFQGKTALVTGATSGIGAELTRRLVKAGLRVYAAGRREQRLAELKAELGSSVSTLIMDVREESSVKEAFAQVKSQSGGLDVLVNNAGLGHDESLLSGKTEHWREMLDVNILGLCLTTREGVALMRTQPEGHVFHLSSLAGHRIAKGSNLYGATKYAVRALTESLRQEIFEEKLPIRVTSVSPGFVETEFHQKFFQSEERSAELYSRQKVLEPADIADAVLYSLGTPAHVAVHDILLRGRSQGT